MVVIPFKDWTLTVDRVATLSTYASVPNGSAEDCGCTECRNYSVNKEIVFPTVAKSLFDQLGIDYRKESEVWRMFKNKDGSHRYNGIFHFKGSFVGKDCFITDDGKNGTFSLTDINESFSIGFRFSDDLTYFKDDTNLVQVEYEINIPWTIERKLEPEW